MMNVLHAFLDCTRPSPLISCSEEVYSERPQKRLLPLSHWHSHAFRYVSCPVNFYSRCSSQPTITDDIKARCSGFGQRKRMLSGICPNRDTRRNSQRRKGAMYWYSWTQSSGVRLLGENEYRFDTSSTIDEMAGVSIRCLCMLCKGLEKSDLSVWTLRKN